MQIEKKSSLTPVSGCVPPGLLCVEVVDRKLNDLIAMGTWSIPRYVQLMHSDSSDISVATTVIASSTITAVSPSPSRNSTINKRKQLYYHRQEVRDSIASRLPVRSQATSHRRRLHTFIARHLLPRTVNRATFSRADPKRSIRLRSVGEMNSRVNVYDDQLQKSTS